MTKLTYAEQLAHPKWQRRRLEMLNAAGWACTTCGNEDKQLHVHHRAYFKGRMAWDYADHELAVLCSTCHGTEHEAKELLDQLLLAVPQSSLPVRTALSLLGSYFNSSSDLAFEAICKVGSSGLVNREIGMAGFIASMLRGLSDQAFVDLTKHINAVRTGEGLDEV